MKTTFLLVVLAVLLSGYTDGSVLKSVPSRANLTAGAVATGDSLLSRTNLYRQPIYNTIQSEDFVYRGNSRTRITAIQALEIGATQYGYPFIISGGIGRNNVTIRVQSARGYGYYYQISVWGRT